VTFSKALSHDIVISDPRLLSKDGGKSSHLAQAELDSYVGAKPMQLHIQYFALMREQAGRSGETLETSAATPAELFEELSARYGFTPSRARLKVAVNTEFSDWSRRLISGDAVVFIPPVAGG